jgi:cytosine/adenosine deaminase-related metal-dependent hydrolase
VALYMDVHRHLKGLDPDELAETARKGIEAASRHGVTFQKFWYNKEEGAIFCLSEAPNKEAAMKAHRDAGEPVPEEIFEVKEGGL